MNHHLKRVHVTKHIKNRLGVLHQDRGGTSLTEFIIGVPAMLIVIVGMMGVYQINTVGMYAKMEATQKAWDEAVDVQEKAFDKPLSMSSSLSGIQDIAGIAGGFGGGIGAGLGAAGKQLLVDPPGGVFIDSFVKLKIADVLFKIGDKKPRWNVEEIMRAEDTDKESGDIDPSGGSTSSEPKLAAMVIHDDKPFGGIKQSKSFFGKAIAAGGFRLSAGAGLRYGHTRDKSKLYSGTATGGISYSMGEQYRIDYPTKSTSRLLGLALAYYTQVYDHPISDATKLYDKGITTFGIVPKIHRPDFGDAPGDGDYDEEETSEEMRQCEEGMKEYSDCVEKWSRLFCNGKKPDCMKGNNAGDKAKEFTDCIQTEVGKGTEDPTKVCGEGPA